MTNTKTAWKVDDDGRLLSPDGTFVALFKDGVIYFYDKKRGAYSPFSMNDWWALISAIIETPAPPPNTTPAHRAAGTWGDK
jgi:hypothetical protein